MMNVYYDSHLDMWVYDDNLEQYVFETKKDAMEFRDYEFERLQKSRLVNNRETEIRNRLKDVKDIRKYQRVIRKLNVHREMLFVDEKYNEVLEELK